jgi:DNA polymerase-3 subunit alpha
VKDWLTPHEVRDLIALSGGNAGELGRALVSSHPERAREVLDYWRMLFPQRFYIELQRTGRVGEPEYLEHGGWA